MNKKIYNYKGNRILKNDPMEIKPNDIGFNPLIANSINNKTNETLYFSKFFFENNKLVNVTNDKSLKLNIEFGATPSIVIPSSEFLVIENINNINDLITYIKTNIDINTFDYNNRILNCFIRKNYKELSKNNKILIDLYLSILKNDKVNKKDIEIFIKKWFKNNNSDNFFLNLGNDLENYLSNKYES
jgi:hypothetical protein